MTIATNRLSFAEYLAYCDGTDTRYELVHGELVEMGIEHGLHGAIIKFLERALDAEIARLALAWVAVSTSISVRSPRAGRWDTARIPDVVVLQTAQWQAMRDHEAVIELNDPAPPLVVEVVSDSTKSTDYRAKQIEYAIRDIPEYWVVDPLSQKVTVFTLVEGMYDGVAFHLGDRLQSPTFPDLTLTVDQILSAGE